MDKVKLVKQLLENMNLYTLPIDVEKIAKNLDIELSYKDFDDSISGVLVTAGSNKSAIVINGKHPLNRKRFSIAHELSHYLLHRNVADVFVDDVKAYFRDGKSSKGELRNEIQANQLAAELLMPEELIKNELSVENIDIHDEDFFTNLANKFMVSNQALLLRLKKLNYLVNY